MAIKARSARGIEVDFDLLRVKQSIAENQSGVDVASRENFVEKRLRRRTKRTTTPVSPIAAEPTAIIEQTEQLDVSEDAIEEQPEVRKVVKK